MRTIISALGVGLLTAGSPSAEQLLARIEIGGLWCPSCSYIAGESMKLLTSVEILDTEFGEDGETAVYIVRYDDFFTSPDKIATMPMSYGYPAKVLLADESKS